MALLAVWTVGRPGEPADPTYSGSINLTANEDEPTTGARSADDPIAFYAFVVAQTPEIAGQVAEDLGEGIYQGGVSTTDGLLASMTVTELTEISTLTIALEGQPNEAFTIEALDRLGVHLIAYATDLWLADYDARLDTLTDREAELRQTIASLTAELDLLSEELTEDEQRAGVSPDLVKSAERDIALEALALVITEQDDLRTLTTEERIPLRVSGPPAVLADPMAPEPLGLRWRLILATALGALLGIGLTFAFHRFDTRLFSRKDAEKAFNMPVLAEVPRLRWWRRRGFQLIAAADPGARASEAYRLLRSSIARLHRLQRNAADDPLDDKATVILVTSAAERVGKTSTAANLAVAAVDAGQKALVISADLRQPTIHRFFRVTSELGLTDCVDEVEALGIDQVDLDGYLESTSVDGVTLLGSGHQVPNPGERLASARPVIERLRHRFDVIVIDSPPMLVGNDVNEIVPFVDLVLLVARAGSTTIEEAQWTRETAERMHAPVCGLALVGVTRGHQQRGAYRRTSLRRLLSKSSVLGSLVRPDRSSDRAGELEQSDRDGETVEPQPAPPGVGASGELTDSATSPDGEPAVVASSAADEPVAGSPPAGEPAVVASSGDGEPAVVGSSPDDEAVVAGSPGDELVVAGPVVAESSSDDGPDTDVDATSPQPLWPAAALSDPDPGAVVPAMGPSAGSEADDSKEETAVIAAVPDISDILSDDDDLEPAAEPTGIVSDGDHLAAANAAATELVPSAAPEALSSDALSSDAVDLDLFDEDEIEDGVMSAVWQADDRNNGTKGAAHG